MIYLDFTSEGLKENVKKKLGGIRVLFGNLNEDIEEVLRWEFEPHEYEKAIASCDELKRSLIELSAMWDFYAWKETSEQEENIKEMLGDKYVD